MAKIIALQTNNQTLMDLLRHHGYTVIDMYEAHHNRASIDAYLYMTYHPDAFTAYYNIAEASDILPADTAELSPLSTTFMLNITSLEPEQILHILERRLSESH